MSPATVQPIGEGMPRRIAVLGGGPGGLYFALLMKQAFSESAITVFERNRHDDTYGWGVVFSDETLGQFREADRPTYEAITGRFRYWQDIETYYRGTRTVSTGHGFAALSRKGLLEILQGRCRQLGVALRFEEEISGPEALLDHDLVVAADGVNSTTRRAWAQHFRPWIDWRPNRFCWLGTTKPLPAFTFVFKETEWGLFVVHAYPYEEGLATWIVECGEEAWRRAGLESADEAATVAFCQELFAEELDGHPLLANRSIWRSFPTVQCERWFHDRVVLVGDAAHTAHFSVGSGTKLAMEDAIALVDAFRRRGHQGLAATLQSYEDDRWVEVIKLQKAAQTSLEWFENAPRYMGQHPLQLTFNLMTRSKRITYDNLAARDPELVARVDQWFHREVGSGLAPCLSVGAEMASARAGVDSAADPPPGDRQAAPLQREPGGGLRRMPAPKAPPPMFAPFRLRGLELVNRVVVSPMCQYTAVDGVADDWHLVHLGTRAQGGAGLVITEMTDVTAEGRITLGCTGLYERQHVAAWKRIVDFVHAHTPAKIGIQLAHAGRKGSVCHPWEGDDFPLRPEQGAWQTLGPSPIPFRRDWPAPREMDRADMDRVRDAFVQAMQWSEEAGFDLVELHMAHGYLLSSFLSSLSNRRRDEYGGPLENRMRYPLEVFAAMREIWPRDKPMTVRVTASDWMRDASGITPEETVEVARALKALGCDAIDVSSGGNVPESDPDYGRMYQVPFAEQVRYQAQMPVMAVGAILGADHANTVIAAGRADLAVMARPHLHDPYLTVHAAERYGYWDFPWPDQYLPARPRAPRPPTRRALRPYGRPAWKAEEGG